MSYVYDDEEPHPHFPFRVRFRSLPVIRRRSPEYTTVPASLRYLDTEHGVEYYPQACITEPGMIQMVIEPRAHTVDDGFIVPNGVMEFRIYDKDGVEVLQRSVDNESIYLTLPTDSLYVCCYTNGVHYCLLQLFEANVDDARVALDVFYRYSTSNLLCYRVMCSLIQCIC